MCDAMTQDLVGTIYIVRNNAKSELWRFDEFVEAPGARKDSRLPGRDHFRHKGQNARAGRPSERLHIRHR